MNALTLMVLGWSACAPAFAAEVRWQEAFRALPVPPGTLLNRDNAADVMFAAFRSNAVVKAIVILPGVANDFYLIHRDAPKLNLRATNLLEAITALTNATSMRATFQAPFLLLHGSRDALEPAWVIEDETVVRLLKQQQHLPHVHFNDTHWEKVQPALETAWRRSVRPSGPSPDAWHFDRHNVVGWGLTDWELVSALALSSGTRVTVQKRAIAFQLRDRR